MNKQFFCAAALITLMTAGSEAGGAFAPDFADEIVAGSCVTHAGVIRHEPTRAALEGPAQAEVRSDVLEHPAEPAASEGDLG